MQRGARRLEAEVVHPGGEFAYELERGENAIPFFWTKPRAELSFATAPTDAIVALFASSPEQGRVAAFNGQPVSLRAGFAYYPLAVQSPAERFRIDIDIEPWRVPGDSRELGVRVSHAIILPAGLELQNYRLLLESAVHYEITIDGTSYGYPFDNRQVLIAEICRYVVFRSKKVLDVGSSFGHFHPHIYAEQPAELVAIDYSIDALRVVRAIADLHKFAPLRTVHANVDYESIVTRETAGAAGSYDVVLLSGIIYHVLSPLKLILEACALVCGGGVLAIETHFFSQTNEPFAKLGFLDEFDHPGKMKWMLSESLLRGLLASQGFEIEHATYFTWPDMRRQVTKENSQRILLIARKQVGDDVLRGFALDDDGQIATKPAPHW